MTVEFTIPGSPKGKARPRICRIKGRNIAYTPRQTLDYEKLVKESYEADSNVLYDKNIPLKISVIALFPIPKTVSKKLKNDMLNGKILPTKKPDCDNIIKVILDALNGVAYHDDSQVCKICFEKTYAETPCVKVKITNLI